MGEDIEKYLQLVSKQIIFCSNLKQYLLDNVRKLAHIVNNKDRVDELPFIHTQNNFYILHVSSRFMHII